MTLFTQLLINGITNGVLYAMAAVGFALIFWTTKVFHVSHGATYLIAGYLYVALFPVSWILATVVAAGSAIGFGYLINVAVYRPVQRSSFGSLYTLVVASLGVMIVVQNSLSLIFGSRIKTVESPLEEQHLIGGIRVTTAAGLGIVAGIVALLFLRWYLTKTDTGIGLRAMADSGDLVDQLGLDKRRYASVAFILGSAMIVPSAILITHLRGLTTATGLSIGILAVVCAIVGGVGSLTGAVFGAMLFAVTQSLSTLVIDAGWQEAVGYAVLLSLILFRPAGLLSTERKV